MANREQYQPGHHTDQDTRMLGILIFMPGGHGETPTQKDADGSDAR